MAVEVEAPDGSIVEFPDGTPPDVMKSAMQKKFKPISKFNGYVRSALSGATLGFNDEIEAGVKTGFGFVGDYDKTVKGIRDEQKAFGKANPISSTLAEVAGSVPTMLIPGLGWGNVAAKAGQGAAAVAKAAVMPGIKTGAIYGAGTSENKPDTLQGISDMGKDMLTHAAIGGVTAPAASVVGDKIGGWLGRASGAWRNIKAEAADPALSAQRVAKRAFDGDQTSADDLMNMILPTYGKGAKAMPPDRVQSVLSLYGETLGRGGTERQARQIAEQTLVANGAKPAAAAKQVREIVQRYERMHQIPAQLHELPALRAGSEGAQSNMTMRVAANRINPESDTFRGAVRERQLGIGERVEDIITTALGGRDGQEMLRNAEMALKARNRAAYGLAEQADDAVRQATGVSSPTQPGAMVPMPTQATGRVVQGVQPIDITAEVIGIMDRYKTRADGVAKGMLQAANNFLEPNTSTGVRTLRQFIDQKEALDDMIEASMTTGANGLPKASSLTRELTQFKKALMKRVGDQNPLYRVANDGAAEGWSHQRAAVMARNLATRANNSSRDALRTFHAAPDEAKDMIKVMYAQNLADLVVNTPRTGNVAKHFNSPASRRIVMEILGPEDGANFLSHIDRAGVAGRTSHQLTGQSQTTPLAQAMKDLDIGETTRQLMSYGRPSKALESIAEFMARKANSKRDAELLKLYGASTDRPDLMIEALRRIQGTQMPSDIPNPNVAGTLAPFSGMGAERFSNIGLGAPLEVTVTGDDVARHRR